MRPTRPAINRAHPLARDLLYCAGTITPEALFALRPLSYKKYTASYNAGEPFTVVPTDKGNAARSYSTPTSGGNRNAFYNSTAGGWPRFNNGLTLFALCRPSSYNPGRGGIIFQLENASTNAWIDFNPHVSGIFTASASNAGLRQVYDVSKTHTAGSWYSVVGVFKPGDTAELYVNGLLDASGLSYTPSFTTATVNIFTGLYAGVEYPFGGDIVDARAWNRALTARDVASLYADPWAMYTRRPPTLRGSVAAGLPWLSTVLSRANRGAR